MIRPPLIILAAAAVLAAAITFWPGEERAAVAEGLLPASSGPRLAATGVEEPSSAARMTRFAGAGAPTQTAEAAAAPAGPPPPPPADALPVLVGVMGKDGALTGYFSSNGQSVRARRGDSVDGWRVVSLGRRDARLVKGRKTLKASLFSARSGPLSPAMAAPERRALPIAASDAGAGAIGPVAKAAPRPPPRVRKPPPPLPPGSKGYWIGPPGSMPPGFTPMPKRD